MKGMKSPAAPSTRRASYIRVVAITETLGVAKHAIYIKCRPNMEMELL